MNLERFKNYSYTDEYIGICFRDHSQPEFVYKSEVTDFGNNRECFFGHLHGKQSFKGSLSEKHGLEVLLPINETTLKLYEIFKNSDYKEYESNNSNLKNYINTLNDQYDFTSTNRFYYKYKDSSVKISTIDKDFVYEDSNITEEELKTFIKEFKKKFEFKGFSSWSNSFGSYISGNQEKFIADNDEIDMRSLYSSIHKNTKYQIEELTNIFKGGLLLNNSYNINTISFQALLEYSTHNPKIFGMLQELTYGPNLSKEFYDKVDKQINVNLLKNSLNEYLDIVNLGKGEYAFYLKDDLIKDSENLINKEKIELIKFTISESNLEEYKIKFNNNIYHGSINKFIETISYKDMILPKLLKSMKPFEPYNEILDLIKNNINSISNASISYYKPNTKKDYIVEDLSQKRTISEFEKIVKNSHLNELNYIKFDLENNNTLTIVKNKDLNYTILDNDKIVYKDIPNLLRDDFKNTINMICLINKEQELENNIDR